MRKRTCSPEQTLHALRQAEAGKILGQTSRALSVTEAMFSRSEEDLCRPRFGRVA